jgi:hypothetical protein
MNDYNPRRDFVQCLAVSLFAIAVLVIGSAVFASVMDGPLP